MTLADDNIPATRGDVRHLGEELRGEMEELRGELRPIRAAIAANTAAITSLRNEMLLEIGAAAARVVNVLSDQMREIIRPFDDRYRDLPARVAVLETELQRHISDDKRHADD
jgi:hypothetical protein